MWWRVNDGSVENYIGDVGGEGHVWWGCVERRIEVPLSRVAIFDRNRTDEFGSGYYRIWFD